MGGLHCSDCEFCSFCFNDTVGMYQAACARGYTLADPHIHHDIEQHFAKSVDAFVPLVDPFGREYLRKTNVCDEFVRKAR